MYHIDVNALYNVALGAYDFDLVVMVAEKSQKVIDILNANFNFITFLFPYQIWGLIWEFRDLSVLERVRSIFIHLLVEHFGYC